jgi:hypothetical protein
MTAEEMIYRELDEMSRWEMKTALGLLISHRRVTFADMTETFTDLALIKERA